MTLTREEEVWLRAYCATLAGAGGFVKAMRSEAPLTADETLQRFQERFPATIVERSK